MAEKKNIIWTTGRRKTAVARVRMLPGTGTITVNERTLEDYFPRPTSRMRILEPFEATETVGQYDVSRSLSPARARFRDGQHRPAPRFRRPRR